MPIVVESSAVPVHGIAFRASSQKQAQELARFAALFGGAFSPARRPERSTPSEITSPSTHNRLICSHARTAKRERTTRNNRRYGVFLGPPATPCRSILAGIASRNQAAYVGFPLNRWDRDWPSFPVSAWPGGAPMTTTAVPSAALATMQPVFTDAERIALAGFLAGYRGLTREAYALDLRQFTSWCRARSLALFAVRRADIEGFARDLEAKGRARATVTRRLSTISGF
jgi:hypothetical protein